VAVINFNREGVKPDTGAGGLLPDGDYEFELVESDIKVNSKQTGSNFEFVALCLSPPEFKGRKVYDRITNVTHTNPIAQKIGEEKVEALCRAIGYDRSEVTDTEELHFKPFWANVASEEYEGRNGKKTKNVFKKFHFEADQSPPAEKAAPQPAATRPAPSSRPATAPGAAGARTLPWKKAS
jgi:hypothetical protein